MKLKINPFTQNLNPQHLWNLKSKSGDSSDLCKNGKKPGMGLSKKQEYLGNYGELKCVSKVMLDRPSSNGVSIANNGSCYAETEMFGRNNDTNFKSCFLRIDTTTDTTLTTSGETTTGFTSNTTLDTISNEMSTDTPTLSTITEMSKMTSTETLTSTMMDTSTTTDATPSTNTSTPKKATKFGRLLHTSMTKSASTSTMALTPPPPSTTSSTATSRLTEKPQTTTEKVTTTTTSNSSPQIRFSWFAMTLFYIIFSILN